MIQSLYDFYMQQIQKSVASTQKGKRININGNLELMLTEDSLMKEITTSKGTFKKNATRSSQLQIIREIRLEHMLPYFLNQLNELSVHINEISSAVSHPLLDALIESYKKSGSKYNLFLENFNTMYESNENRRVRIDLHRLIQVGVFLELIKLDKAIVKKADEAIVYSPYRLFNVEKKLSWSDIRNNIANTLIEIYPAELEELMNISPVIFLDKSPIKKMSASEREFYFQKDVPYGFNPKLDSNLLKKFTDICEDWILRKAIYESASEGLSIISNIVFSNGKIPTENNINEFFLKPYAVFKHYMRNYATNQFLWVWRELDYKDFIRSTIARQNNIDAVITEEMTLKVINLQNHSSNEYFPHKVDYEKQFKATTSPLPLMVYTLIRWQQGILKYA